MNLSDLDPSAKWGYRVIGYSSVGGVTHTVLALSDAELDAAHDEVVSAPRTRIAVTAGPLRISNEGES